MTVTSLSYTSDQLAQVELPVTLAGEEYVLKSAMGDVAARYKNAMLNCTQLGPEGKPQSIKGMANVDPLLVSLCLFKVEKNADGAISHLTPSLDFVQGLPFAVQQDMAKAVKDMSELDQEESVEEMEKQITTLQERITKINEDRAKNALKP